MFKLFVILLMVGIPIGTGFWIAHYLKGKYLEQRGSLAENVGAPGQTAQTQGGEAVMSILKVSGLLNSITDSAPEESEKPAQ